MPRRWLPHERTRDSVPLAGIMGVLCGLGVLASALAGFETVRMQAAHFAAGALSHAARSPVWVRSDTSSMRPESTWDAGVEAGVRDDGGRQVRSPPAEEPFSRGEDRGRPVSAKHHVTTDARAQLMGAANLARHRVEPGFWTTRDEPEAPLRYGDQ